MTLPVHLVDVVPDTGTITVTGDEAHHAVAVRRLRVGERVLLTDGRGRQAEASVAAVAKRALTCTVEEVTVVPRPEPELVVVQALPKGDRGELAVEVLTEVGVARIVPWAAERSVATWRGERGDKAHARWLRAAREAAKQSRRAWLPDVAPLATTAAVAGLVAEADLAVVLHESATASLADLPVPGTGTIVVVVGPEGGLTDHELQALADAHVVRLGAEVLRTSTAGLAACAALLAKTPRWG